MSSRQEDEQNEEDSESSYDSTNAFNIFQHEVKIKQNYTEVGWLFCLERHARPPHGHTRHYYFAHHFHDFHAENVCVCVLLCIFLLSHFVLFFFGVVVILNFFFLSKSSKQQKRNNYNNVMK